MAHDIQCESLYGHSTLQSKYCVNAFARYKSIASCLLRSRIAYHIPAELIFSNQSETEPARLLRSSLSDILVDAMRRSSASCACADGEHSAVLVRLLFPKGSLVSIFLAGFGSSAASGDCMRTLHALSGLLLLLEKLPAVGSKLWEKGAIFCTPPLALSAVLLEFVAYERPVLQK